MFIGLKKWNLQGQVKILKFSEVVQEDKKNGASHCWAVEATYIHGNTESWTKRSTMITI